jgi:predicted Zn finger-like uncharacterized protein
MPVLRVRCPHCASSSRIDDGSAGRAHRCPQCGRSFRAGAAPGTAEGDEAPPGPIPAPGDLPERIGRFYIRRRVGCGAFGTVYLAHDPTLDREVALKVPQPGVLADPRAIERFLREAKAAAQLRHPHIVPLYDAGRGDATYYLASAFIPGRTLSDALASSAWYAATGWSCSRPTTGPSRSGTRAAATSGSG